jgi:ADP-heptose:LPS heptosyltransferase
VLAKLRRRYPKAQIDWLVTPENGELIRCHPALSNLVYFNRRGFRRSRRDAVTGVAGLLTQLRRTRYDLVVDLHGQFRSAVFALATRAPVRVGFARPIRRPADSPSRGWAGAREFSWLAYTHHLAIQRLDVHAVDRYLWLSELLGLDDLPPDHTLYLPPEAEAQAGALLGSLADAPNGFAVIAPGTMWETKHWRAAGFAETARALRERGVGVVLVGTKGDEKLCREISAHCPDALDLAGKTSPADLGAIVRRSRVMISNDSGAMHLAVAMGTPVTAIFGPTDPVQVGPYGALENVVRAGVPCSPCNFRRLSQCPHDHACMRQVSAEAVMAVVDRLLAQPR